MNLQGYLDLLFINLPLILDGSLSLSIFVGSDGHSLLAFSGSTQASVLLSGTGASVGSHVDRPDRN